jgi:hypothetical protein
MYPALYRPFLRQPDLATVFVNMQETLRPDYRLRLTKVSSLRRLGQSSTRRRYESELIWTDLDFEEAFAQAAQTSTYFRRLSFEVCHRAALGSRLESTDVTGMVNRHAHFATNSHPTWLFRATMPEARRRSEADFRLASNRDRFDSANTAPRAVIARFGEALGLEQADTRRIAELLRRLPATSVSVLHANPYLNATVVDLNDGSAFDVVMASDTEILILPQLRATQSAVTRMCRFIYDQIGEATFEDAS